MDTLSVKKDICRLTPEELKAFFRECGEKPFRAQQAYEWIWKKACRDFDAMTNLSKATRDALRQRFTFAPIHVEAVYHSRDGTLKNRIRLHDGNVVESAVIPAERRVTACVSSQVGCSLDCRFCATARLRRQRNLSVGEIYDQVATIRTQSEERYGRPLTNVVFMGMGEPLLNYGNVLAAIHHLTSPHGLHMAARRITLSTVGIPKLIKRMADEGVKFNLAVSLHAALDATRSAVMPINRIHHLEALADSLRYWYARTQRKVTYEYIVWKGVNDDERHLKALLRFCGVAPCKVNLIEYNPIADGAFTQADDEWVQRYQDALERRRITTRVRRSRGRDIHAACGQLANTASVSGPIAGASS